MTYREIERPRQSVSPLTKTVQGGPIAVGFACTLRRKWWSDSCDLEAGGAYVPLERDLSEGTLEFMAGGHSCSGAADTAAVLPRLPATEPSVSWIPTGTDCARAPP